MDNVVIGSNGADVQAAEAVVAHHAEMAGALAAQVGAVLAAARTGRGDAFVDTRDRLVAWCRGDLVPHALAEEQTMYPAAAARPEARLLVEAMVAEHRVITGLVDEIAEAGDPLAAAAAARALLVLFASHLAKENEQVLPLLVAAPDVSVATMLGGMHELLGGHAEAHTCDCHEAEPELPELDARAIPHAIRHATVFGALDAVERGSALVLVAPHDPLPLLGQLERRAPGAFSVDYLERGPEAWRLRLTRLVS